MTFDGSTERLLAGQVLLDYRELAKAPDGRILIDMVGYGAWVERGCE